MNTTVVLTGMLPFVVMAAAVLSLPVCVLLLRLYRRTVLAGMETMAGTDAAPPAATPPGALAAAPLRIVTLDHRVPPEIAPADAKVLRRAARGAWVVAAVYACAGLAYAAVMTAGWLLATRDATWGWTKLSLLSWTYFWPAVPAALMVSAYDRKRRLQVLGTYFAVLALIIAIGLARNPAMGAFELPMYWLITNGAATILLMTFLLRPIRAVGPLVLSYLLMVALGSQTLLSFAAADETALRLLAGAGFRLGLGASEVFLGMILLGMLAFGALGWPFLLWIGRRYEAGKLSDQSLTIDAMFLLFAGVQSIGLAFEGAGWILTGPVAFVVYKTVAELGFRLCGSTQHRPRTLLVLRVFRLGKRSEKLFDKVRRHWQAVGAITMISGPDLVTTTVEPHEFLEFLRGRLGRRFVAGAADLERRIAAIEPAPDPDGRYRIHEFFCRADTWQMTMQRLAAAGDAVLMDLRSFAPANQGCRYELGRLLDGVDLARVVLLVDGTTDRAFLEETLRALWSQAGTASPNRLARSPSVRLLRVGEQSEAELVALIGHLLATAPQKAVA